MDISHAALQRLEHIEFLLQFRGWVARQDLMDFFGVAPAAATRDFKKYSEEFPNNAQLNKANKKWEILDTFEPKFEQSVQTIFSKLRNPKISQSLGIDQVVGPPRLYLPDMEILSTTTRAISNQSALKIGYAAASRESDFIEVVPHSLVDNGIRWHVRAYDRSKERFWDFVLGRITSAELIEVDIPKDQRISEDHQWNRIVKLDLAPHPNPKNLPNRKGVIQEYGMTNGALSLNVRAAVAGYWLRLWNVDCSENYSLKGKHFQLSLRNRETLYDVSSAAMAPGYVDADQN